MSGANVERSISPKAKAKNKRKRREREREKSRFPDLVWIIAHRVHCRQVEMMKLHVLDAKESETKRTSKRVRSVDRAGNYRASDGTKTDFRTFAAA